MKRWGVVIGFLAGLGLVGCSDGERSKVDEPPLEPEPVENRVELAPVVTPIADGDFSEVKVTDKKNNTYSLIVPTDSATEITITDGGAGPEILGYEAVSEGYIGLETGDLSTNEKVNIVMESSASVKKVYQYIESEDLFKEIPVLVKDNKTKMRINSKGAPVKFIVLGDE